MILAVYHPDPIQTRPSGVYVYEDGAVVYRITSRREAWDVVAIVALAAQVTGVSWTSGG